MKQTRKQLGLTQEAFARKMKVSRSTVASWESGSRNPSPRSKERAGLLLNRRILNESEYIEEHLKLAEAGCMLMSEINIPNDNCVRYYYEDLHTNECRVLIVRKEV
ncbi:hypothetical protein DRO66_09255 [Candidatus Bathyarchaeota archaeon]|nr:MAG: hypothetical protein DRO66_09255 [Candidatus Bathyarchaeota archaeon]